ncbi:lipid carrier--UDP-N-acetylgalactosaminyltransferase [Erythrobacter sp. KY5]|uniref:sugar transferase n=1 Tax=Erythrobacter sp. KY5 TaxID=2011159 RepID=UPI000DBF0FDF|nr:sugar transferase [Erythrobacter sp. KY5]AWW73140.1 lipid carrier--UDP-N-acetylgalactosaminyltransferase [Erythrobacter sp. KY5]
MKRLLDFTIAATGLILLAPLMGLIAIAIRIDSPGPALFWSQRFGRGAQLFAMPKFRTMRTDAPQLPTHLVKDSASLLTGIGGFLRTTSLDELPQLWSVLVGDMSLVGPRPALFNQADLIEMRRENGSHTLTPGITGWAQVNGRDVLTLQSKVALDGEYHRRQSLLFDCRILALTFVKVVRADSIQH